MSNEHTNLKSKNNQKICVDNNGLIKVIHNFLLKGNGFFKKKNPLKTASVSGWGVSSLRAEHAREVLLAVGFVGKAAFNSLTNFVYNRNRYEEMVRRGGN